MKPIAAVVVVGLGLLNAEAKRSEGTNDPFGRGPTFVSGALELQVASLERISVTIKSEPSGLRVYVARKSSDAAADKAYFVALTAPAVAESTPEPNRTEDIFKGITPVTVSLSPGSHRVSLRTPPAYNPQLLRVWRSTVPQGMTPRNLVARGSCTKFPQLYIGQETECFMGFGALDLEWVAKEYSLEIGSTDPQEFSVIFQKAIAQ